MNTATPRGRVLSFALGAALLLASGCNGNPAANKGGVDQGAPEAPAEAPGRAAGGAPGAVGQFVVDSVTIDAGAGDAKAGDAAAADAGPNCTGGGDPSSGVDGGSSCMGSLAQSTFQYALCSCTSITLGGQLTTDGYDSTKGSPDGGAGGSVGADNGVSWSNTAAIGGALWAPGNVQASGATVVRGNLELGGTLTTSTPFTVDGNAYTVKTLPKGVTVDGTTSHPTSIAAPCNCANPVPIASMVAAHRAPNNDDATIGLNSGAATGAGPGRIDLPCGNYYLTQINVSTPLTVYVHGHTALYVDGNVAASASLAFLPDPTATLDLFVNGTISASGALTIGSTSHPAQCRAYVAGSSFAYSATSTIGCNIYAPNAAVSASGSTTAFGEIFANSYSASGSTTIHYDTSVANAGGECCSASKCDDGNPCTVDSCNGDGTCSHTAATNGTACTGTNLCDQTYACQAGACVGSNPVTCTASDSCHTAGTCNTSTGACSNPVAANGTTCSDGNACTQTDTCQAGVCQGANPVTCTASDQCHAAGTCNTSTGACSNPVAANGTTCSDGNACTQTDTCQAGVCAGSNPVTCAASDQCHTAGTCNTSTGACSNPVASNGTTCSDGNACTQTDTCQAGVCAGANPVTCAASDQCHTAGTCNTSTGACSNPVASNGTTCSDGNACTQTDTCQAGVCAGSNPVTCTASDQCHTVGTCNTSTGACSNPVASNGTTCSDGNACTQTDTCQAGVCAGSNPVTCTASDQCHTVGTCNTSTGACSNPVATNGTACSDGSACTQTDTCQSGTCTGANPVTCTASDQCHTVGTCNTSTGACSNPVATNGTTCSDGNACTQTDTCQSGTCAGANPVTCTASDQCHTAGTCNTSTGACSNPVATNGTTCSDGNACTQADTCQAGVCAGSNPVTCTASDQCHSAGTCNTSTGTCSNPVATNGTTCSDGNACTQTDTCQSGTCAGANPVTCTTSDQCHTVGTCNTSTGACSNPVASNGTTCSDGNACTQTDTCQSGTCTGSNSVTCTASDQCHTVGTCNTSTGACSNPVASNGTACSDGNACTQTDTCQSGTCAGSNPVTCTASDQCHAAGVCNASSGTCSNPTLTDGTACSDGNVCTQTDSCVSGTCTGASPMTCTASDQCHAAGSCDPVAGCSNPSLADGTTCSDGNACTQTDTCLAGTCTGSNPVVCVASDACHAEGSCRPSSGTCSNPSAPDGTTCTDGNACTQSDACQAGTCVGSSPVVCTAADSCHQAGVCNPSSGTCSDPAAPDGTSCNAGNACTTGDSCLSGSCQAGTSVLTGNPNACTLETCDPVHGVAQHVCSTLNLSVSTVLATSTAFLYSGTNPIQTGVASGTIMPARVAVIRGHAYLRSGSALPGVTISIANHPEFGTTTTQADGGFDMAVNGGQRLLVNYTLTGYLPVQRSVLTPWQDYVTAKDVVMVPLDPNVTAIDLTNTSTFQVAQGSVETDLAGTRQVTILVPPGTQATMTTAGGTTPLNTLHVRATEYTVGSNGHATMPGDLPPASGYTYAVELSADEGQSAGATDLVFSQPLPVYLQNFVGVPAGTAVPAGSYSPGCCNGSGACATWVPSANGIALQVVSITNGEANIDVTGDGIADTGAALTSLGITSAELAQVAVLYPVGQSLWRVPVPHFTAWDFNFGAGPPPNAGAPTGGAPSPGPPDGPGGCSKPNASIVACQKQALGETVAVAGTPYSLYYASDRQRGRQPSMQIPLSGPTLAGPVIDIELDVKVAGKTFTQVFPPQVNLTTTFTWDATDAFGRLLQGQQPVTVTVGNSYKAVYLQSTTFGQWGNSVTIPATSTNLPVNDFGDVVGAQVNVNRVWTGTIGVWDTVPVGLGGWSLNVHHAYDVGAHTVHLGDGTNLTPTFLPGVIRTIAGTGAGVGANNAGPNLGNGLQATAAVTTPHSVVVGPDGTVYIGDDAPCIRSIGADGVIHSFAGQCGSGGFSGDGGPATSAQLAAGGLWDMVFGCDGSLYFTDTGNNRIRRIAPNGIITTVVGTGTKNFSGDGGPATLATLFGPTGLAIAGDGTMFIADLQNHAVRRVTPDGIITTVAGNGFLPGTGGGSYPFADGVPATQTLLSPSMIRLEADGSLLIGDTGLGSLSSPELRHVTTDGIIHAFYSAGFPFNVNGLALGKDGSVYFSTNINCNQATSCGVVQRIGTDGSLSTLAGPGLANVLGDNGPATSASLGPDGIFLAPDGTLYIADVATNRLRTVGAPLPGFSSSAVPFTFASTDGTQVYQFDGNGHHLQTLNALTNAVLYQFAYDGSGRLSSVTDVNGDVTQINRDASGNPASLVGPFGQTTTLTVDPNGYLASVTDPASEVTSFTYGATGLMTTLTDPRGGLHQFAYNSIGLLTEDQDAAGGSVSLASVSTGFSVTETSALGRETTLQTTTSPTTGTFSRLNTFPDGTQASLQFGTNSVTTTTVPDGTTTVETDTPDPRFGMLAPVQSFTTKTPSGLTSTQTASVTDTLASGALATLTEQTTLNGNTWTKVFNASTRTWTTTSPVGRTSTMTIDLAGRPTLTSTPNVTPFVSAYDAHGRLTSVTQGSRVWSQAYDTNGYLEATTDPLGRVMSYTNDPVGRPTTTVLADSRLLGTTYDGDGNVVTLTLPSTEVHDFGYTPVDLLASYSPPSLSSASSSTTYSYDLDRDLTSMLRPDSVTVGYGYDSAGRLQTTTYPQGVLSRTYSPTTGLLATLVAPSGETTTYAYDGFLHTGITWTGPVAGSVMLGFDKNFRMTSQTVNGTALAFGYDADGLVTGAGAQTLTLDAQNGRLKGTTLGSVTDAYTYDANGLFATYVASYTGNAIYSESVLRDANGRITQKTEAIGSTSHVWGYAYDVNGRLTDVTEDGNFASHYAYDADDNRTTYTNTTGSVNPTYDPQDRLLTYGSATYTYTENGELTGKTNGSGTTGYTYDALGNLLDVALPGGEAVGYVVDGENRRVGKQVNGTLAQGFLYKDALNVVVQLDGSGNVVNRFVFGSKPNVPDYFTSAAGTFRVLSDHLGSPRLVVNASTGATVEEIDYDEFGNVTGDTSPGLTPFGFAGGLYDRDTGLVRFGARDYDPGVGRWTSKDITGVSPGGFNAYEYANDDPQDNIDLNGPDSEDPQCVEEVTQSCHTYCHGVCSQACATLCTDIAIHWICKKKPGCYCTCIDQGVGPQVIGRVDSAATCAAACGAIPSSNPNFPGKLGICK